MAYQSIQTMTLIAGAAVARNRFVKLNASAQAILMAAATDDVAGVSLAAAAAAADPLEVAKPDCIVQVEAGAAVALGAALMSDATGRAITFVATNKRLGVAMQAAAGAGEYIEVLFAKGAGV
jgi:hypothetical protein